MSKFLKSSYRASQCNRYQPIWLAAGTIQRQEHPRQGPAVAFEFEAQGDRRVLFALGSTADLGDEAGRPIEESPEHARVPAPAFVISF